MEFPRQVIEKDVVVVGAGPAGILSVYRRAIRVSCHRAHRFHIKPSLTRLEGRPEEPPRTPKRTSTNANE